MEPDAPRDATTDGATFTQLLDWLNAHADALLDDPGNNVIGVGIGKKSAGPLDDDSPYCITGFVEKKLPQTQVSAMGVASFAAAVASASGQRQPKALGFEIDVVETGSPFVAHAGLKVPRALRGAHGGPPASLDLQKRFGLLRSGIGITNPHRAYPKTLSVGTLGFFVRDDRGRTYLVSNNHVIADENAGQPGDVVVQPGTLDLTSSELALMNTLAKLTTQTGIARLAAWVDLKFHDPHGIPFNAVDCAAAELKAPPKAPARDVTEIARAGLGGNIVGVASPYTIDPITGRVAGSTRVCKVGRTTGWTEGEVTQIAVVTDVRYGAGLARFRNQIGIAASPDNTGPFSKAGDSGSGILDRDHKLVGLLFAGSENRTLANPIQPVLDALRIALGVTTLDVVIA
ncbi:S1 family peptidase [Methylobacterium trifolii]|uniref:S1 family peptidase n=1 Tax=Methylobacterium trifolii TaxID=1003092 RepID=UPI001EDE766B|nr:S1 family peptidase [Methylobacterium trifolii]